MIYLDQQGAVLHKKLALICFLFVLLAAGFSSCKKDQVPDTDAKPSPIALRKEKITSNLDSLYLYAQQIYLWNDQLPPVDKFKPAQFFNPAANQEIDLYKKEIFALTRFAINPLTGTPYEYHPGIPDQPKFSSLIGPDPQKSNGINNSANNFGIALVGTTNNEVRILFVDPNSPAGLSGLKRGQKIISLNDKNAIAQDSYYDFISSALQGQNLKVTVESIRNDPASYKTIQLNSASYVRNPVLKWAILKSGDKKTGYIAYGTFTDEDNSRRYLEPVFSRFATEGISDLIIDLRYNTGGYQNTSKYLANAIAPQSANGKLMFTEMYNQLMQQGKATILANQPILGYNNEPVYIDGRIATLMDIDYSIEGNKNLFEKEGPLFSLKKVSFIVSNKTASASELLINVLKPYMEVRLAGVSSDGAANVKTYGKPVGFFDISIDKYKVYLSLYQDKNANNEGDFFNGLSSDLSTIDDTTIDFGDSNDPAIQGLLAFSSAGPELKKSAIMNADQKSRTAASSFQNKKYILPQNEHAGLIKTFKDFKFKPSLRR